MSISFLTLAFLVSSSIQLVQAACRSRFDPDCERSNVSNIIVVSFSLLAFFVILSFCCIYNRHRRIRQAHLSYIRNAQAGAPSQNNNKSPSNPTYTQQPPYNPTVYGRPWPVQNPPPPAYMPSSAGSSSTSQPTHLPPKDIIQYPPPSYAAV